MLRDPENKKRFPNPYYKGSRRHRKAHASTNALENNWADLALDGQSKELAQDQLTPDQLTPNEDILISFGEE